jgi:hypothetical protein
MLRSFEKHLLQSLGYALQLSYEHDTGALVKPENWYEFFPDRGPQRKEKKRKEKKRIEVAIIPLLRRGHFLVPVY